MRILVVLPELDAYYDTFRMLMEVSRRVDRLVILTGKANVKQNLVEYPNLKVVDGGFAEGGLGGLRKASSSAKQLIREHLIDIVHDFDSCLIWGACVGRYLKRVRYIASFTRLSTWSLRYSWGSPSVLNVLRTPELRKLHFEAWAEEKISDRADRIVLQSPGLIPRFREKRNIPPHKFAFLPPSVDTDYWRPLPREDDPNEAFARRLQIVFVGKASRSRALLHMINAMNELKKDRVSADLAIVGSVERRDIAETHSLISSHDLKQNIRIVSTKSRDKKLQIMADSDIFIYHSLDDSVPQSVLWAMACGLPILSCMHPGINVLDSQGEFIQFMQYGSTISIAEAISTFNESRRRWLHRTTIGRRQAIEQLSPTRIAKKYADYYATL